MMEGQGKSSTAPLFQGGVIIIRNFEYWKTPKYSDTQKSAVITLKFEQRGSTIE